MTQNSAEHLDKESKKGSLARNLDLHMRRAGVTQTVLAQRSGVLRSTLNNYMTQKSYPSPNKLRSLAHALGVEVDELLLERPDKESHGDARWHSPVSEASYTMSAIPGRPSHANLVLQAALPTDVASCIMALIDECEAVDAGRPMVCGNGSSNDLNDSNISCTGS